MNKGILGQTVGAPAVCRRLSGLAPLLVLAGLAVFLANSGTAAGRQEERPKFYAVEILSEKGVVDAEACLGAPDGRWAEIRPGGEMTLLLQKRLFDRGTIIYRGETDIGIEGWFHLWNTGEEGKDYAWIPFTPIAAAPGMAKDSVDFGSPYMGPSETRGLGADRIRIENAGPRSLFVDAVIGYAPPK